VQGAIRPAIRHAVRPGQEAGRAGPACGRRAAV